MRMEQKTQIMIYIFSIKGADTIMKGFGLLLFIMLSVISAGGQDVKQLKGNTIIEFLTPPNGRHLYDNVFIDETEISNIAYLEYLFYIKNDSTIEFYLSQLPDTTCWELNDQTKDSTGLCGFDYYLYVQNYLRYPGFRYYPVVGVSYEQAINYCKWRSDIVNERYKDESFRKEFPGFEKYDVTVEFRLPTKDEWEYAASGALDTIAYPYGLKRPLESKFYTYKIKNRSCSACLDSNDVSYNKNDIIHKVEFNVRDDYYFDLDQQPISCEEDTLFGLGYIYDYLANSFGLYNMIGNVVEMTASKGIAKGGSFRNSLHEFNIKTDFVYDGPEEWLGFRCVAVVHMRRKIVSEN